MKTCQVILHIFKDKKESRKDFKNYEIYTKTEIVRYKLYSLLELVPIVKRV